MTVPTRYADLFREMVLPSEGGYAPQILNDRGGVVDPETLFGVTINNWIPYLRNLTNTTSLPTEIRERVDAVRNAADGSAAEREATQTLLRYTGAMLTPMRGQSASGDIPARSLHSPRLSEDTAAVEAVQGLAFDVYYSRYVSGPGFNEFPAPLVPYLVDFGINGGTPRARWALAKAMREAGVLSEGTAAENEALWRDHPDYPYISSSTANNRSTFGDGNVGEPYADRDLNAALLDDLRDASPQQLANVISRFNTWRLVYYQSLADESTGHKRFLPGWRNRVSEVHEYIQENWGSGLPEAWPGSLILSAMDLDPEERRILEARVAGGQNLRDQIAIANDQTIAIATAEIEEPAAVHTPTPEPAARPAPPQPTAVGTPIQPYVMSARGTQYASEIDDILVNASSDPMAVLAFEEHIRLLGEVIASTGGHFDRLMPAFEEIGQAGPYTERFLLRDLLGSIENAHNGDPTDNTVISNARLAHYPEGTFRRELALALDEYYRRNEDTMMMEQFSPEQLGNMRITVYRASNGENLISVDPPTR